jgi:hypothetical protein
MDGAHWIDTTAPPVSKKSEFSIRPEQRSFWSFQPIKPYPNGSVDTFIRAALEAKGLKPLHRRRNERCCGGLLSI